ncbi:MAG: prolyl aminopeptidase [gamma proteobacterium symbiont of Stewartia floridana]|nr:MAG: prolyl aminopeptidase [gamma proteobacterium symbiont of Stewartia floridana]
MKSLYSASDAYATHQISVDPYHKLYIEESGTEQGIPVVFLHGGPGSGCNSAHRRFFDPDAYRVILFDQRGAGKSEPLGETANNTTQDLVADLETMREYLGIDRWLLFAGSWGATLSLAYAQKHHNRILGMILRGVFLARRSDLEWFFFELQQLLPQAWKEFSNDVYPCRSASDLINWFHTAVHEGNTQIALSAANKWAEWGAKVAYWHLAEKSHQSSEGAKLNSQQSQRLLAKVKIETHYAKHHYFLTEGELLQHVSELPPMPVSIVHGVLDITCRLNAAWQLHQAIPGSKLITIPQTGHLIDDPEMATALVHESNGMRETLSRLL